jgi:uncharacterized protein (DUF362 family)
MEGEGPAGEGAHPKRHNVIVAGNNATAVDAVGAAVMGFDSTSIRHLDMASRQGYGLNDAGTIWTRGNEIADVETEFQKPSKWSVSKPASNGDTVK